MSLKSSHVEGMTLVKSMSSSPCFVLKLMSVRCPHVISVKDEKSLNIGLKWYKQPLYAQDLSSWIFEPR